MADRTRRLARVVLLVPVACAAVALPACRTAGPAYEKPYAMMALGWETPPPWRPSDPKDAIPKGEWWKIFHDDALDALEAKATEASQTLKTAAARYDQARALSAIARSTLYPQVTWDRTLERQRLSGNRAGASPAGTAVTQSNFSLPVTVSYEADLFGQRARSLEGARASLQASAAQLENVRLVIAAEVASDYFALQQIDAEMGIFARTVQAFERGLELVRARHDGGIASGLDLAQEETLLQATRTDATLVRQRRDELVHALAVLTGQPAPDFHVTTRPLAAAPPPIALGLPSDLLERRPDVAEAERGMALANAQIGVAMASFFPSINLFGSGGWQSASIGKLFSAASLLWAVGASATSAIFDGGERHAKVEFARAGYEAAVATYRDIVLNALREVEDGVSGLSVLEEAGASQTLAVDAAGRALTIATSRYEGGLTNYLDVVSAQQNLLNNERLAAQIQGERLAAAVGLVKALGGGWDASSLAAVKIGLK